MYAETFQVGLWLETQAKWLRWAMQSNGPEKAQECAWNLGQFWKTLEQAKAQAKTSLQWAEILTLDAQSQWCLGNHYGTLINAILSDKNNGNLQKWLGLAVPYIGALIAANGIFKTNAADVAIPALQKKKNAAYAAAESLNGQAVQAYQQAKAANSQTTNGKKVFGDSIKAQPVMDANTNQTSGRIDGNNPVSLGSQTIGDIVTMPLGPLPLWAWAAIGLGVVLLLPKPVPSIQLGGSTR